MAEIQLVRGGIALIDDADAHLITGRYYEQRVKGSRTSYARRAGPYRNDSLLHRAILDAPRGVFVDHINGNGLDNRRANLRLCSHRHNLANRRKQTNNSRPYKGVTLKTEKFLRKPWVASIGGHASYAYLGIYATAEEAAAAYDIAAVLRYGEFACLNFPHVFPEVPTRKA